VSSSSDLFEGVGAAEYNGVWGAWKLASLGLFGVFVLCAIDIARSMRRHAAARAAEERVVSFEAVK
jgi:hypothetical protein